MAAECSVDQCRLDLRRRHKPWRGRVHDWHVSSHCIVKSNSCDPRERKLKERAISESENSTRAATSAAALKRRRANHDFFVLKTTVAAAHRTMQRTELDVSQFGEPDLVTRSPDHPSSQQGVVLALQRNAFGAREQQESGLQIVPFPHGAMSLVDLALDPTAHPEDISDCFDFLIPRATFDQLAVDRHDGANDQFIGRVTTALNVHFARVYGGMNFPRRLVTGGLAPWQLRLARDMINARLEEELSL